MLTQPPDPPYMIYLETTFLVDLADSQEYRHSKAKALLDFLINKKRPQNKQLELRTSIWAVTEAQGVLYGNRLTQKGITPPIWNNKPQDVRTLVPPDAGESRTADQQIRSLLAVFAAQRKTGFELYSPAGAAAEAIWRLARGIGRDAAIFPPDSIHLAMALLSGCSMIITDDRNFVDKIDCYQGSINTYRHQEFSYMMNLPLFQALGVFKRPSGLSQHPGWPEAITALRALGY